MMSIGWFEDGSSTWDVTTEVSRFNSEQVTVKGERERTNSSEHRLKLGNQPTGARRLTSVI